MSKTHVMMNTSATHKLENKMNIIEFSIEEILALFRGCMALDTANKGQKKNAHFEKDFLIFIYKDKIPLVAVSINKHFASSQHNILSFYFIVVLFRIF